MTPEEKNLQELRAIAEKGTLGVSLYYGANSPVTDADIKFYNTFNPQTVISLLDKLEKARGALEIIPSHDRVMGYPTGPEWLGIVEKAREVLKELE